MAADPIESFVTIRIPPDKMSACLTLRDGAPMEQFGLSTVLALIRARGVAVNAQVEQRTGEALAALTAGNAVDEMIIAEGTPPVHGADGRVEIDPQFIPKSAQTPDGQQAAQSGVDHYSRASRHTVAPGQVIGRIVPPVAGKDGVDVHGGRLAAKSGHAAPLRLDDSVSQRDDGSLVASAAGVLEHRPPLLRITTSLAVPGFVDFSTGNIDFPGDVVIDKGVRDCFEVHARRDLLVRGLVEAAKIKVGRDVSLDGGMAAREKGTLSVARDARARYMNNVHGEIARDLSVEREVVNCALVVGRKFDSERCSIVGGELIVARECVVGQIGTESGFATVLAIGRIPAIASIAERLEKMREPLKARVERFSQRLAQLKAPGAKLTHQQAEELTELEFSAADSAGRLSRLDEKLKFLRDSIEKHALPQLTVHRRLFPGVKIWVGNRCFEVNTEIKGPVSLRVSPAGDLILLDTASGNSRPAASAGRVIAHDRYEGPMATANAPAQHHARSKAA